jgi:hypothetical protein
MWHAWERREKCTRFFFGKARSEDEDVDGIGMDLREIG